MWFSKKKNEKNASSSVIGLDLKDSLLISVMYNEICYELTCIVHARSVIALR